MRSIQRSHDAASLADLQTAIMEFEKTLPGWWYTLGICSVSRDASLGHNIPQRIRHRAVGMVIITMEAGIELPDFQQEGIWFLWDRVRSG